MSNTVTKIGKTYFEGALIDQKVTKSKVNEIIDAVNGINDKDVVTQTTSITNTVTLDKPSGVITTVSSTLAGGTNALFQVNNSFVKSDSVVLLTVFNGSSTSVGGIALVNVEGVANGKFEVRLYNIGSTPFSSILKIYFLVI